MKKIHFLWLVVVILLLTALLRIYNLNALGLWGDEGWSVEFSEDPNPQAVTLALVTDLHPPTYFMLLAVWRTIAGDSEVALRLPAVWAAMLTVAVVAKLATTQRAAIFAALVLAIADKHIILSQEARHYTVAFLLMALSSWAYMRWIAHQTRLTTVLYASLIIAGLYVHYYTALMILVQMIHAGLCHRHLFSRALKTAGAASMAFVPWAFVAVYQLTLRPEGILHSMALSVDTFEALTVDFLGRPPILLGLLVCLGLISALKNRDPQTVYAALWLSIPVLVTIAVYPVVTLITDRNMALLLLPIALLAGQGAAQFRGATAWVLVSIILVNGLFSVDSQQQRPPWRALATYVAAHHPADEPVFMDVVGGDKALGYHLRQVLPEKTAVVSLNQLRIDYGVYFLGIWDQFLQQNDGFWIAYWVNEDRDWDALAPMTALGYTRTAVHRVFHLGDPIDLYHYDRLPALNETLTTFGDNIRLHRVKYPQTTSDVLDVSLWWSTSEPLPISYSVSVFLLDGQGRLVAQHDGPPQNGDAPTSSWAVDSVVFDSHRVSVNGVSSGTYQLAVKVYDSASGAVQVARQNSGEYFIVDRVVVN